MSDSNACVINTGIVDCHAVSAAVCAKCDEGI